MYYHFAILLLFRPFIRLRLIDSTLLPRTICVQAARAIHGLTRSYSQLYTLRRTPSFVPYFVLTSTIMDLTIGASPQPSLATDPSTPAPAPRDTEVALAGQQPSGQKERQEVTGGASRPLDPDAAKSVSRGIADLTEMAPCHHFAEQALNILLYLAKRWDIEISVKESIPEASEEGGHAMDAALEPASYLSRRGLRPTTDTRNFFVPSVTDRDMMCDWRPVAPPSSPSTTSGTRYDPTRPRQEPENPLFWPFPLQGRPLIPSGDNLVEAGFEIIH